MQGDTQKISFSIEGNIGVGKTSFLRIIDQACPIEVLYEPHAQWQAIGGSNLLEKFYSDTSRWAYTFQSYVFMSRMTNLISHCERFPTTRKVIERSIYSDRYCFAKNCYEMGTMTALEWKLYQEWFAWLENPFNQYIGGFIYLKADPKVCYERLRKRNRLEEKNVSLKYLTRLHEKHEEWLVKKSNISNQVKDLPVLVLECNTDFEHTVQEQERLMEQVRGFLIKNSTT